MFGYRAAMGACAIALAMTASSASAITLSDYGLEKITTPADQVVRTGTIDVSSDGIDFFSVMSSEISEGGVPFVGSALLVNPFFSAVDLFYDDGSIGDSEAYDILEIDAPTTSTIEILIERNDFLSFLISPSISSQGEFALVTLDFDGIFAGIDTNDIAGSLFDTTGGGFFTDYFDVAFTVEKLQSTTPIPLPASSLLLIAGMGGLVALRRKSRLS